MKEGIHVEWGIYACKSGGQGNVNLGDDETIFKSVIIALDTLWKSRILLLWKFHEELAACRKDLGKINYKEEAYKGTKTLLSILEGIPCCVSNWVLGKLFLTDWRKYESEVECHYYWHA